MANDLRQSLVKQRTGVEAKIAALNTQLALIDKMIDLHDQSVPATATTQPPAGQVFTQSSTAATAPAPTPPAPAAPAPAAPVPAAPVAAPAAPAPAAPAPTPAAPAPANQSSLLEQPQPDVAGGKKKLFSGKKKPETGPGPVAAPAAAATPAPVSTPAPAVAAAAPTPAPAAPAPQNAEDFL